MPPYYARTMPNVTGSATFVGLTLSSGGMYDAHGQACNREDVSR